MIMSAAGGVRNSRGKRAIGVRAIEVLLYLGVCPLTFFEISFKKNYH